MHPQLFHLGSFWLPTYGVLVTTGVLAGLYLASRLATRKGIPAQNVWDLGLLIIFSSMVGAKLLLFINDWKWYSEHPAEIFTLSTLQAAGVFYGGLLAAVAVSIWYIGRHHLPVLGTCDAFAPGIALGHAIGRLGCFSAGCCFGKPTHLPWGVTFTNPLANTLSGTPLGVELHPTQLYEAAIEFTNFVLLYWLFKYKKNDGQVIGAYMFLYGIARYFLEFLRDDPERGSVFGGAMTGTQLISVLLVLAGGALWLRRKKVPAAARVAAR